MVQAPVATARRDAEGNERLTSVNGMVLLVLLAAEGVTILDVRGLITAHIVLGVALIGPVLLKSGSTAHRFWRYYTGDREYVRKGPPVLLLRVLGPVVLASSLAVLATGVGLLAVQPGEGLMLFLHKASFVVWFGAMTVHVLGHVLQAARSTAEEYRRVADPRARRRRAVRTGAVVASLVVGVGLAAALLPSASTWRHRPAEHSFHEDH